jgi:hypothetical protein
VTEGAGQIERRVVRMAEYERRARGGTSGDCTLAAQESCGETGDGVTQTRDSDTEALWLPAAVPDADL